MDVDRPLQENWTPFYEAERALAALPDAPRKPAEETRPEELDPAAAASDVPVQHEKSAA